MHRVNAEIADLDRVEVSHDVRTFLTTANVGLERRTTSSEVTVHIAQFRSLTFVHALMSDVSFRWRRDDISSGRVLAIIVSRGKVSLSGSENVIDRKSRALLILPGTEHVVMDVEDESEVVYMGMPLGLVADLVSIENHGYDDADFQERLLSPLFAFVTSMCTLPTKRYTDVGALGEAASEVSRAVARLIVGTAANDGRSLFSRALSVIADDFPNRSLNTEKLAARLSVSPRTLQLAFKKESKTVSGETRRIRAAAAQRIRMERPETSTPKLAELTGFGSVSAMFRALREVKVVSLPPIGTIFGVDSEQ